MEKGREFQKWPQNYCTCFSLQSGANFPEIAIGYGSPGSCPKLPDGCKKTISFVTFIKGIRSVLELGTNPVVSLFHIG